MKQAKAIPFAVCLLLAALLHSAAMPENETQIYLYSGVVAAEGEVICVKDIALVEGVSAAAENIRRVALSEDITADRYIDRQELAGLLKQSGFKSFAIYGTAVKITFDRDKSVNGISAFVRRGDTVRVLVKRKNIALSLKAKAMNNAGVGDKITIKNGGKKLSGVLSKDGTVVCDI